MFTFQALQLLLFLIPGLFASMVFNSLVSRKPHRSDLSQIIEALVYSMVVNAIYAAFRQGSAISIDLDQSSQAINFSYHPISLFVLLGLGLVVPIILSVFVNKNLHTRALNRLGVSPKSARMSTWEDAFYDFRRYIVIHFEDGRRLYGWPRYYSDATSETYLFIYKPYWIVEDEEGGRFEKTDLDGMLITPNQKINFIGFMPEKFDVKKD